MLRALLSVVFLAASAAPLRAQSALPAPVAQPGSALPARAAAQPAAMTSYLGAMEGTADFLAPGSQSWSPAKIGMALPNGARLRTGAGGTVTVAFTDGSKARLGPNAQFTMEEASPSKISVYVGLGKLESWVSKWAGRTFQARNPVGVASVRGTVFAMDVISPSQASTYVFEGNVGMTDNFGHVASINAGFGAVTNATEGVSAPAPIPANIKPPAPPPPVVPPPPPAPPAAPAPKVTVAPPPPAEVPAPPPAPTAPPQNPKQNLSAVSPSSP